jgi:hypothetical protein
VAVVAFVAVVAPQLTLTYPDPVTAKSKPTKTSAQKGQPRETSQNPFYEAEFQKRATSFHRSQRKIHPPFEAQLSQRRTTLNSRSSATTTQATRSSEYERTNCKARLHPTIRPLLVSPTAAYDCPDPALRHIRGPSKSHRQTLR